MKYLDNIFIKNQRDRLFCVANLEGSFVELNSTWTEQFGWNLDELIGTPLTNFIHPKDIPSTLKVKNSLEQNESIKYENRFQCKNGDYIWLSWTSAFDKASKLVFSILEDITISKRNKLFQQGIQKNLKIGHWEMDLETHFIFWSEMAHFIHETDPKTYRPKQDEIFHFYHPDSIPVLKKALDKLVTEGISFDLELKFITAKGKNIWIRSTGDANNVDGLVQSVYGTFQDVTVPHKTKEQIKQVLKNCPVMIYQFKFNPDGHFYFTMVSQYCNELYGINSQEFITTSSDIISYIYPEDQFDLNKKLQESIKNFSTFNWEGRIVTTTKIIKWVKFRAIPEREEGGCIRWDGAVIETTQEVELKIENEFIVNALKIGIWKWDIETKLGIWDEGMCSLYGIKPGEFNGTFEDWAKFISEDTRSQAMNEFQKIQKEGKYFFYNFQIKTKNGETRYISNHGVVIRNNKGELLKIYGLNFDRTSEAMLEKSLELERAKSQQSAKLASLGEMSAAVAHEINNPLTIILGMTRNLKKSTGDPQKFEARINSIDKSVNRIVKIINALKKFTRESSSLKKSLHALSEIINESLSLTEVQSKNSDTQMIVDVQSNSSILCDDIEIEQVIVNLINNAIDAVKNHKQRWVKIKLYNEKSEIVMRVIDSGKGIPKQFIDKIFEPFFTTKPIGKGTGLGLSISKGIIENHHGSITMTTEDENTCFEVRFPIALS